MYFAYNIPLATEYIFDKMDQRLGSML
jgi:hypothetical protein